MEDTFSRLSTCLPVSRACKLSYVEASESECLAGLSSANVTNIGPVIRLAILKGEISPKSSALRLFDFEHSNSEMFSTYFFIHRRNGMNLSS